MIQKNQEEKNNIQERDGSIWVIIAAFNEETVIGQVLEELDSYPYSVVVIDDGSTDATAQVVLSHKTVLLQHDCNLGQGAAIQTGICYALQQNATRFLITFDADGQHHAFDIDRLLEPLRNGTADVTLGSRFLTGGTANNLGIVKKLFLKCATLFTRTLTGLKLSDTHNGLRAFSAQAAARIDLRHNRMAHASEILSQIAAKKMRYCEVPVTVDYTTYSQAKGQSMVEFINILWEMVSGLMR